MIAGWRPPGERARARAPGSCKSHHLQDGSHDGNSLAGITRVERKDATRALNCPPVRLPGRPTARPTARSEARCKRRATGAKMAGRIFFSRRHTSGARAPAITGEQFSSCNRLLARLAAGARSRLLSWSVRSVWHGGCVTLACASASGAWKTIDSAAVGVADAKLVVRRKNSGAWAARLFVAFSGTHAFNVVSCSSESENVTR